VPNNPTPNCSICSNLLSTNLYNYHNANSIQTSNVTWTYYVTQNLNLLVDNIFSFTITPTLTASQYDAYYGTGAHDNVYMYVCLTGPSGYIGNDLSGSGSGGGVFKQMMIWNSSGDSKTITGKLYPINVNNNVTNSTTACSFFYGNDAGDDGTKNYYAPTGCYSDGPDGGDGAYNNNTNGFLFGGVGGGPNSTYYAVGDSHNTNSTNQEYIMYNNKSNVDSQTGTTNPGAMILMLPDGNTITLAGNAAFATANTGFATLIVMYCFPNN
jgi:hypothetical protein